VDGVVEAGAPGAVALVRTGQRTWQGVGGLGDLHARQPARPVDRSRIGSVTKFFVATVVLQLAGEGRLGLDDSLQRWLPGAVSDGERITIRQLLNQTSGLYNFTDHLLPRAHCHAGPPSPLADGGSQLPAPAAGGHRHQLLAAVSPG